MRSFFTKKYAKYLLLIAITGISTFGITIASCDLQKEDVEATETLATEDVTAVPETEVTSVSDVESGAPADAPPTVPDIGHDSVETAETVPGC